MNILHVTYDFDPAISTEEGMLEQYYTITGWAEALHKTGVNVMVVLRFHRDSFLRLNGVSYYFLKDQLGPQLRAWQVPLKLFKKIRSLDPGIVHLHHLTRSVQTFLLRGILKKKTAIVVQHHGGPMPGNTKRWVHNLMNRAADAFFFSTKEQGSEWFGHQRRMNKLYPVMEGATFFDFAGRDKDKLPVLFPREKAREITGMKGNPVFLWVGRFDNNKDPLTVLGGFETLLALHPGATLYMLYSDDKLAGAAGKKVADSPVLKNAVFLLGHIPHASIEMYYQSADYYVVGSHYEGSGYALSEALRCGCVPVVTDIPSFRMMTDNGRLGALWQAGNESSFLGAVKRVLQKPLQQEARACIDYFQTQLSFDAIAAIAVQHYKTIHHSRRGLLSKY